MKVVLTKARTGQEFDITGAVTKVEWSGSASSAARQLSIDYINAPFDKFDLPVISTGDALSFWPDKEEVFYGQVFGTEKSSAVGTITYTAHDMMKHLLESHGQYNFKNVTPESIGAQVCADVQIPVQYLYPTGINIESMLCDDMTLYDIIMAAYTKAHRITGDKYFPMIYKRGFAVYKTEWIVSGFALSDNSTLLETSIEETMDEIVNVVKIYDANGTQIGEAYDPESKGLYGTFQAIYKQEDGVDYVTASSNLLSSKPKQTVKVKSTGDSNCLSCYYVMVNDATTGLTGRYWISSDSHTWEGDAYTMDLDLEFEAIMEFVEPSEEQTETATETQEATA